VKRDARKRVALQKNQTKGLQLKKKHAKPIVKRHVVQLLLLKRNPVVRVKNPVRKKTGFLNNLILSKGCFYQLLFKKSKRLNLYDWVFFCLQLLKIISK